MDEQECNTPFAKLIILGENPFESNHKDSEELLNDFNE